MPFPNTPRVVYQRNPLEEVICQLRFPSILRIESEAPSQFQELMRSEFPLYRESAGLGLAPVNLPEDVRQMLSAQLGAGRRSFEFADLGDEWVIGLAADSVSLRTIRYERWEDFRGRLTKVLNAVGQIYAPSFYTRIGLRYVDVIRRSVLGLEKVSWRRLLQDYVLGEMADTNVGPRVKGATRETIFELSSADGLVAFRHGLQLLGQEQCYVIDADFFTESRVQLEDAIDRLDQFNNLAGRLFRWSIKEDLSRALQPEPAR